jgi:copper transport protein
VTYGRPVKLLAGLAVALAIVIAGATTASAHAYLIASDPGEGAILTTAPKQALLQFNVPVTLSLSGATLTDANGKPVPGTKVRETGGNSNVVIVDFPSLPNGAYRINWRAWDSIDLHETGGVIDFGVGQAAVFSAGPATATRPSYVETGTRWLELGGISLLLGVAVVWLAVVPALRGRLPDDAWRQLLSAARRRLPLLVAVGYVAAVLGKVGQLGVALAALAGDGSVPLGQAAGTVLLGSRFGQLWLLGMALAIVVALAGRAAIARSGRRWHAAPFVAASLALVLVYAQSSHGSNQSGFDLGQVAFRIVHLVAAGVWVGGLTAMAAIFLRGALPGPATLAAFRLYGGLAVLSVGALAASGLVLAGASVGTPEELITTTYGWTLIAKVLAVAVVLVAGLRNSRLAVPPRAGPLAFEVGAMLIVLWGAAALGATPPAPVQAAQPATASLPIIGTSTTKLVDDLSVSTSLEPGHPGHNTLFLQLHGNASVPFRPITDVRIALSEPGHPSQTLSGTFIGRGRYTFTQVDVADTGQMSVRVDIVRSPGPNAILQFDWPITPTPPASVPLTLPTTPWAPVLDVLAGGIGLLVLGWLLAGVVRGRRQSPAPAT